MRTFCVWQVASVCRDMMLEMSALQAQLSQLHQERKTLEEEVTLRLRERYDPLVRGLFSTCIQLKVGTSILTGSNPEDRLRPDMYSVQLSFRGVRIE